MNKIQRPYEGMQGTCKLIPINLSCLTSHCPRGSCDTGFQYPMILSNLLSHYYCPQRPFLCYLAKPRTFHNPLVLHHVPNPIPFSRGTKWLTGLLWWTFPDFKCSILKYYLCIWQVQSTTLTSLSSFYFTWSRKISFFAFLLIQQLGPYLRK